MSGEKIDVDFKMCKSIVRVFEKTYFESFISRIVWIAPYWRFFWSPPWLDSGGGKHSSPLPQEEGNCKSHTNFPLGHKVLILLELYSRNPPFKKLFSFIIFFSQAQFGLLKHDNLMTICNLFWSGIPVASCYFLWKKRLFRKLNFFRGFYQNFSYSKKGAINHILLLP